ncbi:hypothetical protein FB45DRAFT_1058174 [Roridomyces roridus]|uniref:MYND-type domain-containing protein n=1 Tax=Roridomyces roridus TaxID=1738132 RepID=A0AAD7BXW0_9AGAR|nr:hypothetical protein FB45DRAFT_1058174 [Roridomyces roridus]
MSSPMLHAVPPSIQLASSDPRAWDEKWQKYFAFIHAMLPPTLSLEAFHFQTMCATASKHGPKQYDGLLRHTRSVRQALCEIQLEMTRDAAPYFVGQDSLQRRWMSATPERRGDLILAALVYTCCAYDILHQARYYCEKELDVESHRRDSRLFLKLLEEMMVQNPTATAPDTPIYISHPVWDALAAEQQVTGHKELVLTSILADRNMLIGFVLCFTVRSLLDLPLPKINSTGAHKPVKPKSRVSRPMEDVLRGLYGDETAKGITKAARENEKADHIQRKEAHAKGKQVCQTCKEPNETEIRYPRCKQCWDEVGREVTYCSSKCQKVDWKAGHKKECGRLLHLEDLATSAPEQQSVTPQIGPPLPGFKRSGTLIFQVSELNRLSPEYDYIIFLEYERVYVSFQHPSIRAAFRACRDKAMATGDRHAVAMLGHFLCSFHCDDPRLRMIGVKPGSMMGQLLTEFDFPDIMDEVNKIERQMQSDGELRSPIILDAGVSAAEWKAMPSTWVDIGIVPVA